MNTGSLDVFQLRLYSDNVIGCIALLPKNAKFTSQPWA